VKVADKPTMLVSNTDTVVCCIIMVVVKSGVCVCGMTVHGM
jgi:hypothetical protein